MKIICPNCKSKLEVEAGIEGSVECPSCAEVIDLEALRAATCPICGCKFEDTDEVRVCPDCKTPHHDECWEDNRGCSTYGCKSASHQETHTTEGTNNGLGNDSGMIACPACGTMHPSTDLVCGSCGKLLGDALPGNTTGARIKETVCKLGSEAKVKILPILAHNFRLLGLDMAFVFRLWWGEFSRYAQFSGVTSRKEYIAFLGVNIALIWSFAKCDAMPLVIIVLLAIFLPTLASTVRRLRDISVSPWMLFAFPILPLLLLVPSSASKTKECAQ